MSSCSSCTSASQQVVQQLLQKATNPAPQPDPTKIKTPTEQFQAQTQDTLNTSGDRGTQLNLSA